MINKLKLMEDKENGIINKNIVIYNCYDKWVMWWSEKIFKNN